MSNAYPPPYQAPHVEPRKKGNKGKVVAAAAAFVGLGVLGVGLFSNAEPVTTSAETPLTTTTAAPTTTPQTTTRQTTSTTTTSTTTTTTVYAPPPDVDAPNVDVPDVDRAYVPVPPAPAPVPFVAPAPIPVPIPEPAPYVAPAEVPDSSGSVYYKNCTAVRNAGAAPIYAGEPGYADHLDGDGDGVGCEN
ncbi:MAG: excalibur calcium-binding domain-containing protein [Rhodococcus sp. (in: high G+C Gram-positive bacteria)]